MSNTHITESMQNASHFAPSSRKGIGLIEMALFIGVTGMFLVAGAQLYHVSQINTKANATRTKVAQAQEAVNTYYFKNGRLPCPAPRTAAEDTATYGKSVQISNTRRPDVDPTEPTDPDDYVYDCSAHAGVAVATAADGKDVQIGALPVRDLGLPAGADLDSFGHRLIYAVTADYTTSNAADVVEGDPVATDLSQGAITINDSAGRSATSGDANVVFALIAPGPDDRGAYNSNGKLLKPCDTTAGVLAGENCDDTDTTFVSTTIQSSVVGAQHFMHKVAYMAGKKVEPGDPPVGPNPSCNGGNMIGNVAFIVDTSHVRDSNIPEHRGDPPTISRLTAMRMSLDEVLPELLDQKKDDPIPAMVGLMDMADCASGNPAADRQCIFGTNGGFTAAQVAGGVIDGPALDAALPTIVSNAATLAVTGTERPIYDRIEKAADAVGEGQPGSYNTIVVLGDGANRGKAAISGGRRGMIKYIAENYPNLNIVFISTAKTVYDDYLRPVTKKIGGVKKTFQLKGYYVWARNRSDYTDAIKKATICY